jgi:hypothetical protein
VKRHFAAITLASAGALAFFGVLLTLNRLIWVGDQVQRQRDGVGGGHAQHEWRDEPRDEGMPLHGVGREDQAGADQGVGGGDR